jgi:hypothetical protein
LSCLSIPALNCGLTATRTCRFPPPWSVDDPDMTLGQPCFIVRDEIDNLVIPVTSLARGSA